MRVSGVALRYSVLCLRSRLSRLSSSDGAKMAKDVHRCVEELVQKHASLNAAEAKARVLQLMQSRHYVQDIWSS